MRMRHEELPDLLHCGRARQTRHVELFLIRIRIRPLLLVLRIRQKHLQGVIFMPQSAMFSQCRTRSICGGKLDIAKPARLDEATAWPAHIKNCSILAEALAH